METLKRWENNCFMSNIVICSKNFTLSELADFLRWLNELDTSKGVCFLNEISFFFSAQP